MMPKRVNIAGISYEIVLVEEGKLKTTLKEIGVSGWRNRYSYWDPLDTRIYISQELPDDLKEFFFCLEVFRAWSYYVGDKLGENDRIIRPYASQLRLLLKSFRKGHETKEKQAYIQ
jgi:hypothetical protein